MGGVELSYCVVERKACVGWVNKYFKDCLCNLNDEISFVVGIISLICWGVAEIPQIVTNFKNKSSSGVSLAFLCTWILGDVFNLVGCVLEPATLPTQFFTALLYTATTVVLVLQAIYYDHFLPWWKCRDKNTILVKDNEREALKQRSRHHRTAPAVEVPCQTHYYFTSARTLASSDTPTYCYIMARSGPPALQYDADSSSEDETVPLSSSQKPVSQPRSIPRATAYGTFLAAAAHFPVGGKSLIMEAQTKFAGRRLLQEHEFDSSVAGQWLGWLMAAIYMGGRVPQIWLNIKRGSVEGLNPLMFVFVLIANATYVGSILVRSTEWEKMKANMPWLLDAVACVVLDLFIILQYLYYTHKKIKKRQQTQS
ncbi:PREDICTED: probable vacuolar amino acid transporter YPQ3 [Ipomoea nil]|uniref:probable vacuolar amino acid transporter YPQ3 n=1 Tax=Ipomoea nil TaxID=35883 RepID=UPI0009008CFE|nr:PREDICTED: probable vacuolar amino acid transporter YPQ3 [Ipomoea nil]